MDSNHDDIERLIALTRSMLPHLDIVMAAAPCDPGGKAEFPSGPYDRMFGSRISYVSILVDLAGLMMKLKAARHAPENSRGGQKNEPREIMLSEQDMLLINEFLQRQREFSLR